MVKMDIIKLLIAHKKKLLNLFIYFLHINFDINSTDYLNNNLLHYTVKNKNIRIGKLLLEKGLDINSTNYIN